MIKSSVATPTPHADYTLRYNRHLQSAEQLRRESAVEKNKTHWHDYYQAKRQDYDSAQRVQRAQDRDRETQMIRQYEVLDRRHGYRDYKYQYYIGTLFDTYI